MGFKNFQYGSSGIAPDSIDMDAFSQICIMKTFDGYCYVKVYVRSINKIKNSCMLITTMLNEPMLSFPCVLL